MKRSAFSRQPSAGRLKVWTPPEPHMVCRNCRWWRRDAEPDTLGCRPCDCAAMPAAASAAGASCRFWAARDGREGT